MPCTGEASGEVRVDEPCICDNESSKFSVDHPSNDHEYDDGPVESNVVNKMPIKANGVKTDRGDQLPTLLPGESDDGHVDLVYVRLYLTLYRIILIAHNHNAATSIPLVMVDSIEAKDLVLLVHCRDGRVIRLKAENSVIAMTWFTRLTQKTCTARKLEDIFAFKFTSESFHKDVKPSWLRKEAGTLSSNAYEQFEKEFKALGFETGWRISSANKDFVLCSSYPQYLIVPSSVSDEDLRKLRSGRFFNRFATATWRCRKTGAVLLRCAQPSIGFFGNPNDDDVKMYNLIRSVVTSDKKPKILIVDARSYTAAWANKAKGGGFETSDTYPNSEVEFMSLPNIHNIRYSFHQLRNLLFAPVDEQFFLQSLQGTQWFTFIANLINCSKRIIDALCEHGMTTIVHCSDGWDRTTQIVSLCKLIADPRYRTFQGFETLVRREWVEFGHKFADRNGILNGDPNERSPVFLQWLDCVHQLWTLNPEAFEFNQRYLMKLAQHSYSGLFGTFLFNSVKDASEPCISEDQAPDLDKSHDNAEIEENPVAKLNAFRLFSVWDFIGEHNRLFKNPAYEKRSKKRLRCPCGVSEIRLWKEVYCCTDAETLINNPEEEMRLSANGNNMNGMHPSDSMSDKEKACTLSRSQSASSLTSLEQLPFGLSPGVYSSHHLNGSLQHTCARNCSTESRQSYSSTSSRLPMDFLDMDGLTKVPIPYEDCMIAEYNKLLNEIEKLKKKQEDSTKAICEENGASRMSQCNGTSLNNGYRNPRNRHESVDSSSYEYEILDNEGRSKHDSWGASSISSGIVPIYEGGILESNSCKQDARCSITRKPSENGLVDGCLSESPDSGKQHRVTDKIGPGACRKVEEFEKVRQLGEGTYGVVYEAIDKKSGDRVALKKVRVDKNTEPLSLATFREIHALTQTNHKNIVRLKEVAVGKSIHSIALVMELASVDLGYLMDLMKHPFTESQVKCLMMQLFEGYRPPELLFGDERQTPALDLWAAGCILGELVRHQPLLPGKDEIHQIRLIINLLGTPTKHIWPDMKELEFELPHQEFNRLRTVFPEISEECLSLLKRLLAYDPNRRISASDALFHDYFSRPPLACEPSLMPSVKSLTKSRSRKSIEEVVLD